MIVDQEKMRKFILITRIATNTATDKDIDTFTRLVKEDAQFRETCFAEERQDPTILQLLPMENITSMKTYSRRLKAALDRVLREGGDLPPKGPPLLPGDKPPRPGVQDEARERLSRGSATSRESSPGVTSRRRGQVGRDSPRGS